MRVCNQLCVFIAIAVNIGIFGGNHASAATPYFGRAILVGMDLTFGSVVTVDSFDSSDPNASDNGEYSPTLAKDTAIVAIATARPLNIGNAKVAGYVSTVNSSLTLGPGGSVGDRSWLTAGTNGIQPGHHLTNSPIYRPQVQLPFTNGLSPLVNGTITTTNGVEAYSYLFDSGDYAVDVLSGKIFVRGQARVLVRTAINVSGNGKIEILEGASLIIYCAGESVDLSGYGVINRTKRASNFQYFGVGYSEIRIAGSGMIGCIYAPDAALSIWGGGGSVNSSFIGSFVSNSLYVNGRASFHYDEALGKFGPTWEYPILHLAITTQGTNGLLRVIGPPGTSYTLQSTTDTSATNWHDFWSSRISAAGFEEFPIFLSFPTRFFRTMHP
ncbi:MAG: hypothetical protein ACK4UN_16170 [Limisphaerales bacterium]